MNPELIDDEPTPRPNWKERLDEVCRIVVETEADMQARCCLLPAVFEDLSWAKHTNGKFRITFNGKALIEAPAADRVAMFPKLEDLADAADEAMADMLGDE